MFRIINNIEPDCENGSVDLDRVHRDPRACKPRAEPVWLCRRADRRYRRPECARLECTQDRALGGRLEQAVLDNGVVYGQDVSAEANGNPCCLKEKFKEGLSRGP